MQKRMSLVLTLGMVLAVAASAAAQTHRTFVDISAAGQTTTTSFITSSTFSNFGETGSIVTNQNVGKGFVFDLRGGRMFRRNLGVGVGLWFGHENGAAASTASIPDPLIVGQFATVSSSASDLHQTDVGFDIQLLWVTMVRDRFEFAVSGGPTILHVSQEIGSISVRPGTQSVTPISTTESGTTGKAGNIGLDVSYIVTRNYGVGGFIRYAGGSVTLDTIQSLKAGGLQLGGGVRLRF